MPITNDQATDTLFKKLLAKSQSDVDKQFFEELNSHSKVLQTDIWENTPSRTTPSDSVTAGIITLVSSQAFQHVAGTDAGYKLAGIENLIPFNYGTVGSVAEGLVPTGYNYVLKTSVGTTIPFGLNDWYIDAESATLIFFGGNPPGVSPTTPPVITCYRYSGSIGVAKTNALNGFIERVKDKLYTLVQEANFPGILTALVAQSNNASASGILSLEINGTPVTFTHGTFVVSSTAETNDTISANGSFVAGDRITMTVSSASDLEDMGFTMKYDRQ